MKAFILNVKESRWTMRVLPVAMLTVLVLVFSILTGGRFSTVANLKMILNQALIVGTVATGAAFVYGTGNVNLSMGACTALAATVAAMAYLSTGSVTVMFLTAFVIGVVVMFISSLLSVVLKVKVLFVTIVMMTLLSSLQQVLLNGETLALPFEMTSALSSSFVNYFLFAAVLILCIVLFHFTAIGRSIRFIGSNEECARQTGLYFGKYLIIAFVVAGIGVGAGAMQTIIRSGTITNATSASLNMDCMLAIVLGGMPVYGGSKSKVYAGITGALMVCILNSGLLMVGVSTTLLQGFRGVIFICLVLMTIKRPELLPKRD